jgi:carotenoid cleavage dioxygenase-like enzyme
VVILLSDEMFTFGYSHEPPYCTYRVITKDGVMLDPVPITIPESVMMHDFAITENYSIFMDLPLMFRPKVLHTSSWQIPYVHFFPVQFLYILLKDALVNICFIAAWDRHVCLRP